MNDSSGGTPPSASDQPWREANGRTVLLAARGHKDQQLYFPPLPPTSPLFADYEIVALEASAALYSYTVVHAAPKAGLPPTPLCLADFPEGLRVFGRLVMPDGRDPVIGEPLRVCTTHTPHGPIYAFTPMNGDLAE